MATDLPAGSDVFIDANIFIYHFAGPTSHTESCSSLLRSIEEGRHAGFASSLVLAETLHRLMIIEATTALQIDPKTAVRRLKAQPSLVKQLTRHLTVVDTVHRIGIEVLSLDDVDVRRSLALKQEYGLLTNDSLNLAVLLRRRLTCIATNDPDFEQVAGLTIWKPASPA